MSSDDLPPQFNPETHIDRVTSRRPHRLTPADYKRHADTARELLDAWDDWYAYCTPKVAAAACFYAANYVSPADDYGPTIVRIPARDRGRSGDGNAYTQFEVRRLFDTTAVSIRKHYRKPLRAYAARDDVTLDDQTDDAR